METYLWLEWTDTRLKLPEGKPVFSFPPDVADKIWIPDLFIAASTKNEQSKMLHDDVLIRLKEDGRIIYGAKFFYTISCNMKFYYYPLDEQFCYIAISSCELKT